MMGALNMNLCSVSDLLLFNVCWTVDEGFNKAGEVQGNMHWCLGAGARVWPSKRMGDSHLARKGPATEEKSTCFLEYRPKCWITLASLP